MPVWSDDFLYLLAIGAISYIWIIFISITTRIIAWIITLIIFLGIIIKVPWFISVVMFNAIIWNRNLNLVIRPYLKIACWALRNFRNLLWYHPLHMVLVNFRLFLASIQVIIIFRRLMCKNETLFLFRRHCLIHYNGIILVW